jgi:hypothetical protein
LVLASPAREEALSGAGMASDAISVALSAR